MKSILVTGGSGLVGSALNEIHHSYKPNYYFVFVNSTVDLRNYQQTIKYFSELKPDYIIHLAACVGGLFKNMSEPVKMLEDNLLINTNVIKAANETGVNRLIACLSTCVFPNETEYPINEKMINNGPPHLSNEGYSYAKRIMEIQCKCYNKQFGREYICVIPTNVYGPHDNFHLEDSHVIPGLIHRCFLAKQNGKPFIVRGSGTPRRQFIYSLDLARVIMEILQNYNSTDSIIISPEVEYSIKEVSEAINTHFGNEIIYDQSFSDGQHRKTADSSKLLSFLPGFSFTPLDIGITETIEWFKRKYPNVRL